MKQKGRELALALVFGLLLPMLMVHGAGNLAGVYVPPAPTDPTGTTGPAGAPKVRVRMGEETVTMDLEEYLVGVVLGEMPASFEPEALKAQAVVARTYTLRRHTTAPKHPEGGVCTDPACCQAWRDPAECDSGNLEKVRRAVQDTAGLVLTYEGSLIEATYFASSGGRTEDAVAVWGSDLPYLQAVDSPEEAYADRYMATVTMTAAEFSDALGLTLSGSPGSWVRSVSYTNGGGVETMDIGGHVFRGTELRSLLGLRSTAFVISASADRITVTTRGHGHRVGMSQYGAQAMALAGSTFDEILAHYYPGTILEESIDIVGLLG